jgi:hypothetical protein
VVPLICTCALLNSCGGNEVKSPASPSPVVPVPTPPAPASTYSVSGTVVDGEGKPVEGAAVFVGVPDPRSGGAAFSTTTDAQGRFRGALPSGSFYSLSVSKPGYESVRRMGVSVLGDTVLDVTLVVGIEIFGNVTELGVGPLNDATIEVMSGPSAGRSTVSGPAPGKYGLQHLLPGEFTLRASKTGYDSVEQTVRATTDTLVDFSLKWAYGTCLRSVTPTTFDFYPSAGGAETVPVEANAGRSWTVTTDSWIELHSAATVTGSGAVAFRVLANSSTTPRRGAVMIRCSASEGQNIWITQNAACRLSLESAPDSPAEFGSGGGIGHLLLHVDAPACRWSFRSQTDWIRTSGITDWDGDLSSGIFFVVSPNGTGLERVGTVVVGETVWQVRQQ